MFNPTWFYVGAVYAVGVWLARRAGVDIRPRVATFFYLIVLLFFWRPMTSDAVNLPVDYLQTLQPWVYYAHDPRAANAQINDLTLQLVPWAHQVRESWLSGHVPLWNSMAGSGYPLLANGQSSALSPLRLLALPLPLGFAMTAEAAWKLLLGMTFTYLFCRRRGYSDLASAFGGICYGFCSFLIVWLHFPLATVAALLPAVLYQLDLLAEKLTYGRIVFAAVLWTVMLFGGHPETVAHAFFLAILMLLWVIFVERRFAWRDAIRFVLALGGAMTLAALMASPFLATFAEAMTKSKRYHELKAYASAVPLTPYSDWPSFILTVQPQFLGEVPFEAGGHAEAICGFAGFLGIAGWFALVIHIAVHRAWRSREMFLVLVSLIAVGIFMAWPGVSDAFHFFFHLAANGRLRGLFALMTAIQAAALIDLLQRGHIRTYLLGILGATITIAYMFFSFPHDKPAGLDTALLAILPTLLVLLFAACVPLFRGRGRELALLAVIVATLVELWKFGRAWNPVLPASAIKPETPLITKLLELKAQQSPNTPFRIVGLEAVFFPNVSAMYGLEDIRAHDPMAIGRYIGLLTLAGGYGSADYFAQWKNTETRLLDYLGVKYVVTGTAPTEEPNAERYILRYQGRDGRIYENRDALPRFYPVRNVIPEFRDDEFVKKLVHHSEYATTAILDALILETDQQRLDFFVPRPPGSPDATLSMTGADNAEYQMTVRAPRWTLVVSSIPWAPGWKVIRNGKRIDPIQVNGTFLGYAVPPGTSEVHVEYSPMTWTLGASLSLTTMAALALIGAWRSRKMRAA